MSIYVIRTQSENMKASREEIEHQFGLNKTEYSVVPRYEIYTIGIVEELFNRGALDKKQARQIVVVDTDKALEGDNIIAYMKHRTAIDNIERKYKDALQVHIDNISNNISADQYKVKVWAGMRSARKEVLGSYLRALHGTLKIVEHKSEEVNEDIEQKGDEARLEELVHIGEELAVV